jgi:hypothetical protein
MKRWLLIPLGALAVVLVWLALDPKRREAVTSAVGLTAPPQPAAKAKPICASPMNPNVAAPTDCIPQHLANLPPDPGDTGKLTIDGVDVDKDGIRDDVQRWIAENWGHSEVAVTGLTIVAQVKLLEVHHGDDLGKAETRKLGPDLMRKVICASHLETQAMLKGRAYDRLYNVVTNTPERWKRSRDFDQLFANSILMLPNDTPAEACGFDPRALAARSGEQTINAQLAAEQLAEQAAEEAAEQAGKKEEGK